MSASSRRIQSELNASKKMQRRFAATALRIKVFRDSVFIHATAEEDRVLGEMVDKLLRMSKAREGAR